MLAANAGPLLESEDLPLEVEYEQGVISQYPSGGGFIPSDTGLTRSGSPGRRHKGSPEKPALGDGLTDS